MLFDSERDLYTVADAVCPSVSPGPGSPVARSGANYITSLVPMLACCWGEWQDLGLRSPARTRRPHLPAGR